MDVLNCLRSQASIKEGLTSVLSIPSNFGCLNMRFARISIAPRFASTCSRADSSLGQDRSTARRTFSHWARMGVFLDIALTVGPSGRAANDTGMDHVGRFAWTIPLVANAACFFASRVVRAMPRVAYKRFISTALSRFRCRAIRSLACRTARSERNRQNPSSSFWAISLAASALKVRMIFRPSLSSATLTSSSRAYFWMRTAALWHRRRCRRCRAPRQMRWMKKQHFMSRWFRT
mmetsp:Transcript_88777/g.237529  ORF Transcript_88777/g.237529 Transcript_88777/m.237529 type:complete len:234 (-) Transcript_88777:4626-5327(-)